VYKPEKKYLMSSYRPCEYKMTKPTQVLFKNLIKMEECEPYVKYKFTLNPDIKYTQNDGSRMLQFKNFLSSRLIFDSAGFTFCIEASPTGRLHIHGYIVIYDVRSFYTEDIANIAPYNGLMGAEDPDYKGKMTWEEYCFKQQKIMGCGWITTMEKVKDFPREIPVHKPVMKPGLEVFAKASPLGAKAPAPPSTPVMEYAGDYAESIFKISNENEDDIEETLSVDEPDDTIRS